MLKSYQVGWWWWWWPIRFYCQPQSQLALCFCFILVLGMGLGLWGLGLGLGLDNSVPEAVKISSLSILGWVRRESYRSIGG